MESLGWDLPPGVNMLARKTLTVSLALGLAAFGQTQATSPATPVLPAPVSAPALTQEVPGPYRLQVDDIVRIDLGRIDDRTVMPPVDCLVDPSGDISAPIIGNVKAEGRTVAELIAYLKQEYVRVLFMQQETLRLTVTAIKLHQIRASIVGAVNRPGLVDLRRGDRISTLLAYAQGTLIDGSADLRRATLRRGKTQEVIPLDLHSLVDKGDTTQDYFLEDGDVVTVPRESRNQVTVDGEVRNPQVIPYFEGLSVTTALTRAGGRTDLSRYTKVMVIRLRPGRPDDPDYIPVDVVKFYKGIDRSQNIELKPGDIVYVPSNGNPNVSTLNSYFNIFYLFRNLGFNPFSF